MAYFKLFPYLYYEAARRNPKLVTDILRRVAFRRNIKRQSSMFIKYQVKDTDSPESVADRLYDSPSNHWVVLMLNDMFNRYEDWPMAQDKLRNYVAAKYGDTEIDAIHHYELEDGTWTNGARYLKDSSGEILQDSNGEFIKYQDITTNIGQPIPISNFQHEDRINEGKREIQLIRPEYLNDIIDEFSTRIKA